MSDPALFRGRVIQTTVEDSTDMSSPAGERQALATCVINDSDTPAGPPGTNLTVRVMLPNAIPCTAYAANLFWFGTVVAPTLPISYIRANQPFVLIRKDASVDAGTTTCYSTVIEPTFTAVAVTNYLNFGTTTYQTAYAGQYMELEFVDQTGHSTRSKMGYLSTNLDGVFALNPAMDAAMPGALQLINARLPASQITGALPMGYSYAWSVSPLGSNTCLCEITGGGPGASYTANFYALGPTQPYTDTGVPVTQLQISGSSTLATGTWAIATRIAGAWYVQSPVWN